MEGIETMDRQRMKRAFTCHEGLVFTAMFTLIFIVTSLVMIDYRGLQRLMTDMDLFTILYNNPYRPITGL